MKPWQNKTDRATDHPLLTLWCILTLWPSRRAISQHCGFEPMVRSSGLASHATDRKRGHAVPRAGCRSWLAGALRAAAGCHQGRQPPTRSRRYYALFHVSPEIKRALIQGQERPRCPKQRLCNLAGASQRAGDAPAGSGCDFEPNPGGTTSQRPQGFIALGPLAWATLRRDSHLPLGITLELYGAQRDQKSRHQQALVGMTGLVPGRVYPASRIRQA